MSSNHQPSIRIYIEREADDCLMGEIYNYTLYLQWHLLRWIFFVITRVCIGELCLILFLHLLPHLIRTRTNALAVDEEEAVPEGVHDKEGYPDPERVVPAVVCLAISQS